MSVGAVRRLSATLTHGPWTVDVGRQFIRWGKTDIVTPTDHFAPRDFVNVVNSEFLAVSGVRTAWQARADTVDVVWVPRMTPSRMPILGQRWTVLPASSTALTLRPVTPTFPSRDQLGVRWSRNSGGYEWSASLFDGVNSMPDVVALPGLSPVEVLTVRQYPRLRAYGADLAAPNRWFTLKAEASVSTSPDARTDSYVLYGVQAERQAGEWMLLAGYAGEHVTTRRVAQAFAPDRGLSRAVVARASYTVDTNRSASVETAVRQNGHGVYVKGEYSQAHGPHWRATLSGVVIGGRDDDFLGQFRSNSNVSVALRYSY